MCVCVCVCLSASWLPLYNTPLHRRVISNESKYTQHVSSFAIVKMPEQPMHIEPITSSERCSLTEFCASGWVGPTACATERKPCRAVTLQVFVDTVSNS